MTEEVKLDPELHDLIRQKSGIKDPEVTPLKGDGSDRRLYLVSSASTERQLVAVFHTNTQENRDFIHIAAAMREAGIAVPAVYAVSEEENAYLTEYLGPFTLAQKIPQWRSEASENRIIEAYYCVLDALIAIQKELTPALSGYLAERVLSEREMTADLDYFVRDFLVRFEVEQFFHKEAEEELYVRLLKELTTEEASVFVYRDFQARNIMWFQEKPVFIDFQTAYLGSPYYDLSSLLYGSASGLDEVNREKLLRCYYRINPLEEDIQSYFSRFYRFVLIRRLRSLGSYGFLSAVKKKGHFKEKIRPTLRELVKLLTGSGHLEDFPATLKMVTDIERCWKGNR